MRFDADQPELHYAVRHLQRFALGTPYERIVGAVAGLAAAPALQGRAVLVVDQTGVGRPVVEMLRNSRMPCRVVPVTITGGQSARYGADGNWHVPKAELVTSLLVAFQCKRLKIRRRLPDTTVLVQELLNYRTKITDAGNEVFEARRDHDDLVVALALAVWYAERDANNYTEAPIGVVTPGRRSIL
jgi:hypothetical protein